MSCVEVAEHPPPGNGCRLDYVDRRLRTAEESVVRIDKELAVLENKLDTLIENMDELRNSVKRLSYLWFTLAGSLILAAIVFGLTQTAG